MGAMVMVNGPAAQAGVRACKKPPALNERGLAGSRLGSRSEPLEEHGLAGSRLGSRSE